MSLYYPQCNQRRPLILVGPPSIGRHELRQRLLDDTGKFAAPVPRKLSSVHSMDWISNSADDQRANWIFHLVIQPYSYLIGLDTSRPKESGEIDGSDYHFISRQNFEAEAGEGKFLEHGEYDKQYYGTSLDRWVEGGCGKTESLNFYNTFRVSSFYSLKLFSDNFVLTFTGTINFYLSLDNKIC